MLEPQSRKLLLAAFAPPPGHRLDWAVGTTYSLDLIALLAAPVAFAFSDWQDRAGHPVLEPLVLLKATRQYADQMLLFCQAGRIHVPRSYQPLLANLEGSIVEALAPRGGSFHPKVWFLRYLAEDTTVTYRFLCLSRNLTFDRSWDTMLILEGPLHDRANAFAQNHPLGEFANALSGMTRRGLAPVWRKRLEQLAYDLRRVEFRPPPPFEKMAYWPLGIGKAGVWPFHDALDRLLVISPFVDSGFIERISVHSAPVELISRPESLDCLSAEELSPIAKLWVLDETADVEVAEIEQASEPNATPSDDAAMDAARTPAGQLPLLGLHAKAYIADCGWDSRIWTGSANATTAAFDKNVEFLVELRGKKSQCGTIVLFQSAGDDDRAHPPCLGDLLKPYEPGARTPDSSAEEMAFERLADKLAKQIAARAPLAHCDAVEADNYSVSVRPSRSGEVSLPAGYRLRTWPVSFLPAHGRDVAFLDDPWCRFERVSLIGLTAFFGWELASPDERFIHQFVLHVPLANAPSNRSEGILRHLLNDRERVLRFLLLLLTDPDALDFANLLEPTHGADDPGRSRRAIDSTLFESLLRALDRHPEQIDQIEKVIGELLQSSDGHRLLPEGFSDLWEPIIQVRREQRQKPGKTSTPL